MTPDSNYVFQKGTIFVAPGGGGAPTPLPPGINGQALVLDSTMPLGMKWIANGGGSVAGPVSSTANDIAIFADTSGLLLADSGFQCDDFALSAGSSVNGHMVAFSGTAGTQLADSGYSAASFAPATGPAGGQVVKVTSPAGNYTVLLSDFLILANSGSAHTITLPTAPPDGTTFKVKDKTGTAGTNNITVQGAVNIDGSASYAISTNYGHAEFSYSTAATLWYTV